MKLDRTEEQGLIGSSALDWLRHHYGFRERAAGVHRDGGQAGVWRAFAELGWLGMPLPARFGGLEMGALECGVLMQALGRHLVVEPLHACVHEAALLLSRLGSEAQQARWLPAVAEGRERLALAHAEAGQRLPWEAPALRATPCEGGWRLDGAKQGVASGPGAARWILSACSGDGALRLFLVDPRSEGLRLQAFDTTDGRRAADAVFDGVRVPADEALPAGDAATREALQKVLAHAALMRCWEAAGVMQATLEQTIEHLRQRRQFGQPLSGFQVVQHRLAEMAVLATEAQAACELATLRLARGADPMDAAALARTKLGASAQALAKDAVQLHGAMGVSEELPIAAAFRHLLAFARGDGAAPQHAAARARALLASRAHELSQVL